jgi:hypothetical protein
MGWNDRSDNLPLVILGKDGHPTKVAGLLVAITPDHKYKDNFRYIVRKKDGNDVAVTGSATVNGKLTTKDIGHFVALRFLGYELTKNGQRFKSIQVQVHDGVGLTPEQTSWPGWRDLNGTAKKEQIREDPPLPDDPPEGEQDEADMDLPF